MYNHAVIAVEEWENEALWIPISLRLELNLPILAKVEEH